MRLARAEDAQVLAHLGIEGALKQLATPADHSPNDGDKEEMVRTVDELIARHEGKLTPAKVRHAAEMRMRTEEQVARRPEHAEVPGFPPGRYPVLLADPPWRVGNPWAAHGVENHYATMPLEDICALDVPAAEDAALFLWSIASMQRQAYEVIAAWGFEYRTQFVWLKPQIGMGSYVRTQHELLLIATRGRMPAPATGDRPPSVIEAPRRERSRKPDEAYERIEQMYPGAARLELFARHQRDGWDGWGDQMEAEADAA